LNLYFGWLAMMLHHLQSAAGRAAKKLFDPGRWLITKLRVSELWLGRDMCCEDIKGCWLLAHFQLDSERGSSSTNNSSSTRRARTTEGKWTQC